MSDDAKIDFKIDDNALDLAPMISLEEGYGYSRSEAISTLYADVIEASSDGQWYTVKFLPSKSGTKETN